MNPKIQTILNKKVSFGSVLDVLSVNKLTKELIRWTSRSKHGLDFTQRKRTTTQSAVGALDVLGSVNHKKVNIVWKKLSSVNLLSALSTSTFYCASTAKKLLKKHSQTLPA